MVSNLRRPVKDISRGRVLEGLRPSRVLFVATCSALLSTPQVLNYFKILPVLLPLLLAALLLLAFHRQRLAEIRVPAVLLALCFWVFTSALWSDSLAITIVQSIATAVVFLIAAIVGTHCSLREVLAGLIIGGLTVAALSLAVATVSPSYGLMPAGYQGGSLRGLYIHRNLLAEVLAPAAVATLAFRFGGRWGFFVKAACLATLVGTIFATRSSTAIGVVAAVTGLAIVLAAIRRVDRRWRAVAVLTAIATGVAALVGVVSNLRIVFALLQRDDTLTGRTLIWNAVGQLIEDRPFEGYGWGAVWGDGAAVRTLVTRSVLFEVDSAHNGYLEILLQIGLVGLVLFVLTLALVLVRGIRQFVLSGSVESTFGPLLVASLVAYNLAEASMVSTLSLFTLGVIASNIRPTRIQPASATVGAGSTRNRLRSPSVRANAASGFYTRMPS